MTAFTMHEGPTRASLPSRKSTSSYWHKDPSHVLLGHRTTVDLPQKTDVVVIGSGITGAFAARELVAARLGVVMLESREACWGATGRNGGHCKPMLHMRASHVARFELETYTMLRDLVRDNEVPCGWATLGGVHGLGSRAEVDLVAERLAQLRGHHPDLAAHLRLVTDRAELDALRLSERAVGAVLQDVAAMCWPYKLVCWLLTGLLREEHFNLQTGTSALRLEARAKKEKRKGRQEEEEKGEEEGGSRDEDDFLWAVHTDRGVIIARHVVLATNAYTSFLLPSLAGLITPVRGQVAALVTPASSTSEEKERKEEEEEDDKVPRLEHSHLWATREPGDPAESEDYLVHRETGELILGGERNVTRDAGWATSDDGIIDPAVSHRLHAALGKALTGFPPVLRATHEWTGIMGYSADNQPWVGRVPEALGGGTGGLWISAGYTGHGMPVAARCGIAVAEMLLGKTGQGTVSLPEEWAPSGARASVAKVTRQPDSLEEELLAVVEASRRTLAGQHGIATV